MELVDDGARVCPFCGFVEGTPAEEAIHMQPGTLLHDRYIIGRVLGFGGFGVTYIAWDEVLEQKVAIKEYLPNEFSTRMPGQSVITIFSGDKKEQFNDGLLKFLDEAKRLAKFQNEPGIVKIFDSFGENGTAYIVMEYLEGETLTERLRREKTIPEDEAVKMIWPLLNSLQVVHAEGIIHRDIAPDNIFLTKDGQVKLIDFGASRFATTSHSRSLTVIIKPGYSPEEQYRSRGDQGPHTDVYAMGAVLYKMITGKTPPDAMERRAKIESQKKEILVEPHKLVKDISQTRENAILNAMNVQIEDRTADVAAFMKELEADPPAKRRYGKIKKIDLFKWPLWLKVSLAGILLALVVFGTLLATGVISFRSLFSSKVKVPDKMVSVPQLESMDKDVAIKTLRDLKINVATAGNVESEYIEPGKIVLQSPNPDTLIYEYGTVYLTISSGKAVEQAHNGIAKVPYVVWDTKEAAIEKMKQAGLGEPEIIEVHDPNVEAGKVISQNVEYGTEVDEGTKITITVSLGPETIEMPNVINTEKDVAIRLLEGYGLKVSTVDGESAEIQENYVCDQSVLPGTQVKPGDSVVLTISTGSAKTTDTTTQPTNPGQQSTTPVPKETTPAPQVTTPVPQETTPAPIAHTHSYTSTVTKEATCGEDGIRTYTCSCGDSYTEAIPATGNHAYTSKVTKEPDVGVTGIKTYTCSVCGHTYTEEIPAMVLSDWTKASEVPSGAKIKDTKWTYTLTSYTTSTSSTKSGWTLYDTVRTSWGPEQTSYSDPSNGKRNVWTENEKYVSSTTHHWHYYHRYVCTDPNSQYYGTFGTDHSANREPRHTIDLTYSLNAVGTFDGETKYSGYAHDGKGANYTVWYLDYEEDVDNYSTRTKYHYQEPVYTYYYKKTSNKESTTDPTGTANVSNVVKWVRYAKEA